MGYIKTRMISSDSYCHGTPELTLERKCGGSNLLTAITPALPFHCKCFDIGFDDAGFNCELTILFSSDINSWVQVIASAGCFLPESSQTNLDGISAVTSTSTSTQYIWTPLLKFYDNQLAKLFTNHCKAYLRLYYSMP